MTEGCWLPLKQLLSENSQECSSISNFLAKVVQLVQMRWCKSIEYAKLICILIALEEVIA